MTGPGPYFKIKFSLNFRRYTVKIEITIEEVFELFQLSQAKRMLVGINNKELFLTLRVQEVHIKEKRVILENNAVLYLQDIKIKRANIDVIGSIHVRTNYNEYIFRTKPFLED